MATQAAAALLWNARPVERVHSKNDSHRCRIGETIMRRAFLISTVVALAMAVSVVSGSS
jgi:hypothetical protein